MLYLSSRSIILTLSRIGDKKISGRERVKPLFLGFLVSIKIMCLIILNHIKDCSTGSVRRVVSNQPYQARYVVIPLESARKFQKANCGTLSTVPKHD